MSQKIKTDLSVDGTVTATSFIGSASDPTKLPLTGGNMSGDINWGATNQGLTWAMNTDGAYIKFYNTGDGDNDSRLEYGTSDNGNEYHRFMISGTERMKITATGITATGYNKSNWDTAYGWGDHADNLYLPIDGKATDSELLDGLNSTAFIRNSGYANQTEYSILDNGSINGPVIKIRYDSATANRWWDIGFKDGNGTYYEGLKGYNNSTLTWVGQTIIHSGNIGSQSVANASTLDSLDSSQFLRSDESDTMTGSLTVNAGGVGITATSSFNTGLIVDGGNNSGIIADFRNGTTKAVIDRYGGGYFLGDVGIGFTEAPAARLEIKGTDSTASTDTSLFIKGGNSDGYYNNNQILFGYANSRNYAHAIKTRHQSGSAAGNAFDIYTWKHGDAVGTPAGQYVMTIQANGLGIGVKNPSQKLEIADGSFRITETGVSSFTTSYSAGKTQFEMDSAGTDGFYFRTYSGGYANRFVIKSSGKIGIGIDDPQYKLDVAGSARVTAGIKMNPEEGTLYSTDGTLSFFGTNNGVYLNGSGTNGFLRLNASGVENSSNAIDIYGANAGGYINLRTGGNPRLHVANSGHIGINTTGPTARLSVFADGVSPHASPTGISVSAGTGGANLLARDTAFHNWLPFTDGANYYSANAHTIRNSTHTTNFAIIEDQNTVFNGRISWSNATASIISNQLQSGYNYAGEDADFWINYTGYQGGSSHYRDFRIGNGKQGLIAFFDGSTSRVGIGNTNPGYKLDVSGTFKVEGASYFDGRIHAVEAGVSKDGSDSVAAGPFFRWTNAAETRQMLTQLNASNGLSTWSYNGTNWSNIYTLTQSGILGLGATPSAWGSGQTAFEFGPRGGLSADSGGTYVDNNRYYNGTSSIYKQTASASLYSQVNGSHVWYQAPSGTAGNAITFTQAMTLNASGNLSIGNTNNTYKLDVSGTGRFSSHLISNSPGGGVNAATFYDRVGSVGVAVNQYGTLEAYSGITNNSGVYSSGSSSTPLVFNAGASELFRVNATGMGIGTINPNQKLSVEGGSIKLNHDNAAANYYLWLNKKVGQDGGILLSKDNVIDWQITNTTVGDLHFYSYGISGVAVAFQRSNGYIGINKTNPGYRLDVEGDARIVGGLQMAYENSNLYAQNGALSYYSPTNGVYLNGAGPSGWLRLNAAGPENDLNAINIYGSTAGGYIQLRTAGSTRLYVANGGNIGINYDNPSQKLHVNGFARLQGYQVWGVDDTISAFVGYEKAWTGAGSSNNLAISAETGNGISFFTNGNSSNRLFINASGQVGINRTSIDETLHVEGNIKGGYGIFNAEGLSENLRVGGIYGNLGLYIANTYDMQFSLGWAGSFKFTQANTTKFTISTSGTITATGDVLAYSDARVKENIETIDNALDKVMSMRGVSYNRTDNDDKTKKVGVIAQEIQKVLPEVVSEQEDGMLSVSYGNIVGVLIEAIKEQQKQIDELKSLLDGSTR